MFRLMLVNVSLLLLQFEKCIANDICDAGGAHFFTFPPAGSANKRVGKVCLTFLPNLPKISMKKQKVKSLKVL